jgi:hypothetical protein
VLDCSNIEKVVTRKISIKSENVQKFNLLDFLKPLQLKNNWDTEQLGYKSPLYQLVSKMFFKSMNQDTSKIQSVTRLYC